MASLFSITAPLVLRFPSGEKCLIAHHFRHPRGVLYFDLFWHLGQSLDAIHVLDGDVKGGGPWKIRECIVNILGCHGSDAELAMAFEQWQ